MGNAAAAIGGILRGFTGGLQQGMNLGAIFERNKLLRAKFEQTKKKQQSIDAKTFMKRGTDYLQPGTKSYKDHFNLGIELFPDFEREMTLRLEHNDKALLNFKKHKDFLLRRRVPEDLVDQTFQLKGMDGILQLLDREHKREQGERERAFAGAPTPQADRAILEETLVAGPRQFLPTTREETLPGGAASQLTRAAGPEAFQPPVVDPDQIILNTNPQGGAAREGLPNVGRSFAERSLLARRRKFEELQRRRNQIGIEGPGGKLAQKRVDEAERSMIRAETAVEKLRGGKTEGTLEQSRKAFLQGRASREQLALIRQGESKFVKDYVESFGALVGPRRTQELRKQGEVLFEVERLGSNPLPKNITSTSVAVQYLVRNLKFDEDRAKEIVRQIMRAERAATQ